MNRFTISCLLAFLAGTIPVSANDPVPHKAWKLKGAEERIEKHRKGDADFVITLPDGSAVPVNSDVSIKQTMHDFNFGLSMTQFWGFKNVGNATEDTYKKNVKGLFNYITTGYYWSWHEKKKGAWKFQMRQPEVVDFVKKNGLRMKGHPIMWHNCFPDWALKIKDNAKLSEVVDKHMRDVVTQYPDVDEWDSYNEAPSILHNYVSKTAGGRRYLEHNGGLHKGMHHLYKVIEEANPDGKYILNHHKIDEPAFHKLIQYLLKKKVNVHKIGIQTHMFKKSDLHDEAWYWNQLEKYAQHGIPIQLSEITIISSEHFDNWKDKRAWVDKFKKARKNGKTLVRPNTPAGLKFQADYISDYYTLGFSHPMVSGMVYWAGTDRNPWDGINGGLLDTDMNPKPAYNALMELVKKKWWTVTDTKVQKGKVAFRGFYGKYAVTVEAGGKTYSATYELRKKGDNAKRLVLQEL